LGAAERMVNRNEGSLEEQSLIGDSTTFENDARLNREPRKRFQKWDRMGNR